MADDSAAPGGDSTKGLEPESGAVELTEAETATAGLDTEDDAAAEVAETDPPASTSTPRSHVSVALIAGLIGVLALTALTGWLGYRTYESNRAENQRNAFLQVGRQGALNLTTINWETADADVQRVLDSATGTFYDDFQKRADPFIQVVKEAKSKSVGTVAEAGLESSSDTEAQVLVAVTVQSTNAGIPEQQARAWRMRISVQDVDGAPKVAKVDFVA